MYAIVDIDGHQFKVEKDQKIYVNRLNHKEGDVVHFERVLLIDNEKKILVGEPSLQGASVAGKIVGHTKGDKVRVFKKKRRKGYQVLKGHRQLLTEVLIEKIIEKKTETGKTGTKAKSPKKTPAKAGSSGPAKAKSTSPSKKSAGKTTGKTTKTKKTAGKKTDPKK